MSPLSIFTGPMGLVYKWLIIAALAAAAMGWSYTKGISRESDRRDAADLKQAKVEEKLHAVAVAYGAAQAKKALEAEAAASDYQQKWKEARDASKRKRIPLAVADCSSAPIGPTPPATSSGGSPPDTGVRLRLTWELVGLWDSVYTDDAGQPLFGDTARAEKGSAGPSSASPYDLDQLLDNHGTNAGRWDACRRQLRALNATIDGLEKAWDKAHPR